MEQSLSDRWSQKGWGYVVAIAAFFAAFLLDGVESSFGILMPHLIDDLGTSTTMTSFAGGLISGVALGIGPIVSRLIERFGCRPVTFVGGLICFVSTSVSSFSVNLFMFTIFYGVFTGIGIGMVYMSYVTIVNAYFTQRARSIAVSVVTSGSGVGLLVIAILINKLILTWGWRGCYLIVGALFSHLTVIACLMRPLKPAKPTVYQELDQQCFPPNLENIPNGTDSENIVTVNDEIMNARTNELAVSKSTPVLDETEKKKQIIHEKDFPYMDEHSANSPIENNGTIIVPKLNAPHEKVSDKDYSEYSQSLIENGANQHFVRDNNYTSEGSKQYSKLDCGDGFNGLKPAKAISSNGFPCKEIESVKLLDNFPKGTNVNGMPVILVTRGRSHTFTEQFHGSDNHIHHCHKDSEVRIAMSHPDLLNKKGDVFLSKEFINIPPECLSASVISLASMSSRHANVNLSSNVKALDSPGKQQGQGQAQCQGEGQCQENEDDQCLFSPGECTTTSSKHDISSYRQLLTDPVFLLFCYGAFSFQLAYGIAPMFTPSFALDMGLSSNQAASTVSVLGICNMIGRFLGGVLSFMGVATSTVYIAGTFLAGLTCFSIFWCDTYIGLLIFTACYGFFLAVFFPLQSVLLVEILGINQLPRSFGIFCFFKSMGLMLGPFLAGALYDLTKDYRSPFVLAGAIILVASLLQMVMVFLIRHTKYRKK